ncbi:MAG: exosortase S [Propionibacteriales bacterium]|nr:exosortase S [Propionibacteriales bacterium]
MAVPQHAVSIAPRRTVGLRGHPVLGLLLIVLAVVVIVQERAFRTVEATLMAPLLSAVLTGGAVPVDTAVMIGIGQSDVYRLAITSMCSTAVLFVPLLALAGLILLGPRFRLRRVFAGLGVGLMISLVANFGRYALAAWALETFGLEGFDVVHRWAGSLLVIFAFAFAFFVMLKIATGGGRQPAAKGPRRGIQPTDPA